MQSLCHQIQRVVVPSIVIPKPVPPNYRSAVKLLHTLLHTHPVCLFIDSLDQLSDRDLARSNVSFLRGLTPHKDTRIIVSTLPDEPDNNSISINNPIATGPMVHHQRCFYGSDRCLNAYGVPRMVVPDFSASAADEKEAITILEQLLVRRGNRTLTADQWTVVAAAVKQEPTALYLYLVSYVVSQWRSFDGTASCPLDLCGGVSNIADKIFERLERDFGVLLTRAALGFITWSVQGVSDLEMEDLLSLHEEVLAAVLKYCPNVTRLPSHVWLRLRAAMQGLLVEGEHGCLRWYHRQLWEAAERRYRWSPSPFHSLLATLLSFSHQLILCHPSSHPLSPPPSPTALQHRCQGKTGPPCRSREVFRRYRRAQRGQRQTNPPSTTHTH